MSFLSTQTKQSILSALADREIVKILDYALVRERSVNEVIRECNIPHTTAYRKIKWLLDNGLLLSIRNELTEDGKKFTLFKSVYKSLKINYEYGNIVVFAEYNINPVQRVAENLLSIH
ncbi:MAG TPA: helix-turn-helix domain-containing protein [Nitrososphaeraceae archaeon]